MCYDCIERTDVFYGFHRGVLSGLEGEERLRKQRSSYRWSSCCGRLLGTPSIKGVEFGRTTRARTKAPTDCTLEEALSGCRLEDLRQALTRAGISTRSGKRKAELVALLAEELPRASEGLLASAKRFESEAILLLQRTLQGETVVHEREHGLFSIPDAFPFAFVAESGSTCISFTPPELREAFREVDLMPYLEGRHVLEATNRALHAATTICGLMPINTVFDKLESTEGTITREQFDHALELLAKDRFSPRYLLLESEGEVFVTHLRLQRPESVRNKFGWQTPERYRDWRDFYDEPPKSGRMEELLAQQRKLSITRFEEDADLLDGADRFVYQLPCVRSITAYFDAHVPDREDDYTFAEEMVDLLIRLVVIEGRSLKSVLSWLTGMGWYLSEGTNTAPVLTKLVCDLFRGLPRWEYNGWSETEYLDLMGMPCMISDSQPFDDELDLAS